MRLATIVLFCGAATSLAISSHADHRVSGTVVTPDGAPCANANVWLVRDFEIEIATTDNDGKFAISDVPTDSVNVVVYVEGFALAGLQLDVTGDRELTIELQHPTEALLRAVDPQLQPLEGARLHRLIVNDAFEVVAYRLVSHGFPSVRSNAEGRLSIPFMPKGGFARVDVSHRAHGNAVLPTIPADLRVDIVLPFGAILRGRVVDERGVGVADARVTAFRRGSSGARITAEGSTTSDGFFRLVVEEGEVYVAAGHRDFGVSAPGSVTTAIDQDTDVGTLVLYDVALVRGRVLDATSDPVEAARIQYLQDGVELAEALSSDDGYYQVAARLGVGTLQFRAPPGMTVLGDVDVPLKVSSTEPIQADDVRVAAMPPVSGRVQLEPGTRKDAVVVTTVNLDRNLTTRTDSEGAFEFRLTELPPEGQLLVRAEHALRFLRGESATEVLSGEELVIAMEAFAPEPKPAPDYAPNALAHLVGKAAPEIAVQAWPVEPVDSDAPASLAALRGRVVVLVMWGGFDMTPVGVERMQLLQTLHSIYSADDVFVMGVHEGTTSPADVRAAADRLGVTFPVALDTEEFDTFVRYETKFIPQTIVIDREGRLRHFFLEDRLMEAIKDLRRR